VQGGGEGRDVQCFGEGVVMLARFAERVVHVRDTGVDED